MRYTILLIDDEPMIRALLEATLRGDDCRLLHAAGADEAQGVIADESVDLLLLDWNMPGLSGVDLTAGSAPTRRQPNCPSSCSRPTAATRTASLPRPPG